MPERRPTISVESRPDGRWAVQKVGSKRASWVLDRKEDAVARAREQARRDQAELIISSEDRRESRWMLWMALLGLVVTVAGSIGIPLWLASRPDTPEEREAACRRNHEAPIEGAKEGDSYVWSDCSWPPVPGADDDGRFEITMTPYYIPGTSMADKYTNVEVFETNCKRISVQYHFENQGTAIDEKPLVLNMDQIVSGYDGSPEQVPSDLVDKIGGSPLGRLFVVFHGRYYLKDAHCVDLPEGD